MEYKREEITAGIIIVIFIVLTLIMFLASRDFSYYLSSKVEYHVLFNRAEGIKPYTPVRQGGLVVGKVVDISVNEKYGSMVELVLRVKRSTVFRYNSRVSIRNEGILGDAYVDISLGELEGSGAIGPGQNPVGAVDPEETVERPFIGEPYIRLEDLAAVAQDIVTDAQEIVASLKGTIATPAAQSQISNILGSLEHTLVTLDDIVSTNEGEAREIAQNMQQLTREAQQTALNLKRLTGNLESLVQEKRPDMEQTVENWKNLPVSMREDFGKVTDSVAAPLDENRETMRQTLANLEEVSENLAALTRDLRRHPWKLIRKSKTREEKPDPFPPLPKREERRNPDAPKTHLDRAQKMFEDIGPDDSKDAPGTP